MSGTPLPPPALPPPPGTDMTGICFRDQLWLNTYPLDRNLVFDYFALSPFYDLTCNNESLRSRQIHPLDMSHLTKMTGMEYVLSDVMEPHLFVIRKQRRESPEKSNAMLAYYILDGSIYQAPQLCSVFASRISRAMHHISKAFTTACSKLEKIGHVETEPDTAASESKTQKEAIDLKELKRVDHILMSLQRKLQPAPPPPPFPEGYVPSEQEKASDDLLASEALPPQVDPIIDQGPAKRPRFQ
ncbi:Os06g0217500 [Oryza sativa Japonica Group]|uniref:Os06g0217500 protein n=2 Tax=Oryza sativa subsp. japonica TaxID=39947 RepID=Q0DDK9_ORYSJ|nr:mediator of RNA polymerase II transcription subunit 6 isoform X2 [Oryza sativa Japonica Group]BAD35844.1 putative RNA polymerase transcriptional regulation mediator [Oryza sativa Japonica Group]BAF19064.1 Os06g0217500 [Oryza sativa Japonica Group]BAS96797.1 Os06g0217500 [Oryza sativa Japonica Group]|eukprot:NP_001057150.1 Os06g0217500 [Oryza sativa Japonica Group]